MLFRSHEGVNGLDRPDANAMGVEELNRLVKEEFGDGSQTIIDAYRRDYPKATPFDLYAIIAAAPVNWMRAWSHYKGVKGNDYRVVNETRRLHQLRCLA